MGTLRQHVGRHVPLTISDKRVTVNSFQAPDIGHTSPAPGSRSEPFKQPLSQLNTDVHDDSFRVNGDAASVKSVRIR